MRRYLFFLLLLLGLHQAKAQSYGESQGYCLTGAVSAMVQGLPSTNKLSGVIPSCQITVYLHGTQTLATIYSTSTGIPLTNPFTASNTGYWAFYAANSSQYDVLGSGGIPPDTYPTPTLIPGGGGGGGGGGSSPPSFSVQYALNTSGQFSSDSTITINPTSHIFQAPEIIVPGTGTGLIGITDASTGNTVYQTAPAGVTTWYWSWPATVASGCLTSSATGVGTIQGCLTAFTPPTLASAVTAAGSTGGVVIPANYAGVDSFCTVVSGNPGCTNSPNPNGVAIYDQRPKANTETPKNLIYASDFGATCKGNSIDSPAIQAAIDSAKWAWNYPLQQYEENEIVLPQGQCGIIAPLTFTGFHGSMVGAGNDATYLVGLFNQWVGTDYTVLELTATGTQPGGTSVGVRRFSDFAIIGNFNSGIQSTLVKILNTSNVYNATYGIANLDFENILLGQADICIDAEDMVNSQFQHNQIQNCRLGVVLNGAALNNYFAHNTIDAGTLAFTNQTGSTYGFITQQNTKYGGGSEQPQGVYFHDNSVENWTTLILDEECIDCSFDYVQGDLAGSVGMQLDENGCGGFGVWVDHSTFGVNNVAGVGMLVACISDTPTPQNMGLWIEDDHFQLDGYPVDASPSSNIGIVLDSVQAMAEAHIIGNQCMGQATCIQLDSALTYSEIRDNYAVNTLNEVVNLAGAASLVHTHTIVDGNFDFTEGVPAVNVGSSSGAVVLYNCTASGCTTPTWPTLAAGNGFTGTKTAGSCVLTIAAGIITNVTGC
jgi:hypothetical protein